ncbi:MAG: hypothetical protein CL943_02340 [Candidatus Diapherotrites archaeon]|uniref:50S ribosomal protein L1 n=1 Tax=Candidatus Iainarchaeum sp. TaxID=3101447 RepID=A0A2D6M130_9ARCH|nr:hypothetical protein [Candidatus Diapherotrites archaeon]
MPIFGPFSRKGEHQLCWEVIELNEKEFLSAFQIMRKETKKRNFMQSIELMINFRGLDFKKAQNQIDVKVIIPHATGKASGKTLLFAKDKHFVDQMKDKVDRIILDSEIAGLKKKDIALLATEFDAVIAEGPVMIAVGKYLGQELAPRGKMPRPVKPEPNAALSVLKQMSSVTRVTNKKGKFMPVVQVVVGNEKMEDQQLAENSVAVFNAVASALPGKKHNIKSVFVKESMGPSIKLGEKAEAKE